jgi:predicted DNA-binding transcriptional regulator AlpA
MKKANTAPEIPISKAKAEKSVTTEMTQTTPETPITTEVTKTTPKKTSPKPKPAKKAPVVEPEPIASSSEIAMHERVGLTAGSIWHYLAENGETSVAKLVDELPEEEKIIQRSIGWLAQEDKITLSVINQIETIALKG